MNMAAAVSLVEHKGTLLGIFFLLMYFMWMDVALYYNIQAREPTKPGAVDGTTSGGGVTSFRSATKLFSPFNGLTIKMMMIDPANHYIHTPAATIFNELTHFSSVMYFVTPNMISAAHVLVAIVAAKFISSETFFMRQVGVVMFEFRSFLDSLDGVVYRARAKQESNISNFGSIGYIVDGLADTAGSVALVIGCYVYLRRNFFGNHQSPSSSSRNHFHYSKLGSSAALESGGYSSGVVTSSGIVTHRRILVALGCFASQLAISAFFWDRYISGYHQLLENPQASQQQVILQNEVLKSALMWIITWFWRISNAHALLEMVLFSIFVDRLWEFLVFVQYVGLMSLGVLISLTEVHFHDVTNYIGKLAIPVRMSVDGA